MPHSIGFQLTPIPRTAADEADGYRFVRVCADLLIDGTPAIERSGYFFDLGFILAMGATAIDDTYPFTCSCGVPGCVDLNEGGQIEVTDTSVVWEFPAEPFARRLRQDLISGTDTPVRVEFERKQYEEALEAVTLELEKISNDMGFAVDIWPGSLGPECPGGKPRTLREELATQRERILDAEDHYEWRTETYGELLGQELVLTMPNWFVYSIPYENLADAAVSDGYGLDDEAITRIEDDIAPRLHAGFDSVVAVARAIPWSHLVKQLFVDRSSPKGVPNEPYERMTEWPEVVFRTQRDPLFG